MKSKLATIIIIIMTVLAASCASTGSGFRSDRIGDSFNAADVQLVASEAWGKAIKIAEFEPGVPYQGLSAVECMMPYGESTVVWHFSGLNPGGPVEFKMDVNWDFFMTDSLIELYLLPGKQGAEMGIWPKPDWLEDYLIYKWVDSVGRFAGSGYPDVTEEGWETLYHNSVHADKNGEATVLVMINHFSENPPVVYSYFTNPEVVSYVE